MAQMPSKSSKRVVDLVTGATSSLAVELIKRLLKRGHEVRALMRDQPITSGEWRVLPPGIIPYVSNITFPTPEDKISLQKACKDVDNIFHIAGASYNHKYSYNELLNINVIGTENLLRTYVEANASRAVPMRFIYTSSTTVYGYKRPGETLVEESQARPASGYSESKLMAEHVVEAFASANKKIQYTILRIGVLYGPGYEENFFKVFNLLKERRIGYVGAGDNHLTLIHVDDAADGIVAVYESPKTINRLYNLSDGVPYTQKGLLSKAAGFLSSELPNRGVHPFIAKIGAKSRGLNFDQFEFLVSDRIINIDRIKRDANFRPTRSIDREGKELVQEFLNRQRLVLRE